MLQVRIVLAFVAVLWLLVCRSCCRLIAGAVLGWPPWLVVACHIDALWSGGIMDSMRGTLGGFVPLH